MSHTPVEFFCKLSNGHKAHTVQMIHPDEHTSIFVRDYLSTRIRHEHGLPAHVSVVAFHYRMR